MQIGIVGLPFSGKSTLYQTITRTHLDPAALVKAEAHQAMVKVPDTRLDRLVELFSPRKTTHAAIEFVDVVGLKKGESGTAQFTTNFFGNVKNNDALVHVVRGFRDESVAHVDGSIDAMRDIRTLDTEFILADMALLEGRIERARKQLAKLPDDALKRELSLLESCQKHLDEGRLLRDADLQPEEVRMLRTYQLLTIKPMLIALNCGEEDLEKADALVTSLASTISGTNTRVISFFGKIEQEMSELNEDEAATFMAEYGIKSSALDTLIRESYALLGLQSFFTVGEDECRAWTIRRGMNAQEAAGTIHSDFEQKFIRAEVVHYDHFVASEGSFAKAKEAGHWRLEGKEYLVNDGDILSIRHG